MRLPEVYVLHEIVVMEIKVSEVSLVKKVKKAKKFVDKIKRNIHET